MGVKIRSARGEIIDLDLFKIKNQIANTPKPTTVQDREQFIDGKIRRRVRKQKVVISDLDIDDNIKQDEVVEDTPVVATSEPPVQITEPQENKSRPIKKRTIK